MSVALISTLFSGIKRLLPKRPDLKVIITATIDVERFSKYFNDAPIIEVSGRTYPVEVHYLDAVEDRDRGFKGRCLNSSMRSRLKNAVRVATCSSFALASGRSEISPKRCAVATGFKCFRCTRG